MQGSGSSDESYEIMVQGFELLVEGREIWFSDSSCGIMVQGFELLVRGGEICVGTCPSRLKRESPIILSTVEPSYE